MKHPAMWRQGGAFGAAAAAAMLAAFSGCANYYQLGTSLPSGTRSVFMPVATNRTGEPGLDAQASNALKAELQTDGTLKVAAQDQADAVLTVELTALDLKPLRYDKERSLRGVEYRMTIVASVVMTDRRTGNVLARKSKVTGEADFDAVGDMGSAKQRALPVACRDLAHKIVGVITEAW